MRIGIDLGGTKIEIVALDSAGRAIVRRRIASPAHAYGDMVEAIATLIERVEEETSERGTVGVGAPGAPSPANGLTRNANSTVLNGKPFASDLARRLGREVRVANDANCFALSEASDGAATGATCAFGVILGTGVGGGIVVRGTLLGGANAVAGEWGHNPLPWSTMAERPGPRCYCGKFGCIETVAAARDGDPRAAATLERYLDRLARALASVVNLLDPDVIVLGGGLSNVRLLYDQTPARLAPYVFSDTIRTRIVPAAHGDSSGVRGAAWLWPAT
jgi:fructokinase